MSDKVLAAYTPPIVNFPPYINVSRKEVDGSVTITVRSASTEQFQGQAGGPPVEVQGATAAINLTSAAWDHFLDTLIASR